MMAGRSPAPAPRSRSGLTSREPKRYQRRRASETAAVALPLDKVMSSSLKHSHFYVELRESNEVRLLRGGVKTLRRTRGGKK